MKIDEAIIELAVHINLPKTGDVKSAANSSIPA
jgi:hypothetical protein